MKKNLPVGWRWEKLSDVTRIVTGTTPKSGIAEYWDNGEIVWITPTDLGDNNDKLIFSSIRRITKSGLSSCSLEIVPVGSVVLSSRAPIGYLGIAQVPLCTNQGCKSIIPSKQVDSLFLYFILKQSISALQALGSGSTFKEVSKTQLENFYIPLPSLPEQHRIALMLNDQMASVAQARNFVEDQLSVVRALKDAYLREVFDNRLARECSLKTIEDVCSFITDGTHVTPTYTTSGIPFLSVKDIKESGLCFGACRYISDEEHKVLTKHCKPERGDILYTKVGTTGIAKAIDVDREFSIFVSVALLKVKPETIISEYMERALNSPFCRIQAKALTKGMANRNLVLKDLKRIVLPIPTIEVQKQITKTIANKLSVMEVSRKIIESQLLDITNLPLVLLGEAFQGDLRW